VEHEPSEQSAEEPLEGLAAQLAALGAESETERAVKRIVPWVVSLAIHIGLIVFGFLVTWTVVMLQSNEESVLIIADFDAMTYDPLSRLDREQAEVTQEMVQDRVPTETFAEALEDPADVEMDPINFISDAASDSALARFAPDPSRSTATFVGLSSTNARRIVYVIDASGSMIRSLPIVIEAAARASQLGHGA
jgi:hypothetical protein